MWFVCADRLVARQVAHGLRDPFHAKEKRSLLRETGLRRTHCIPLRGSRSNCGSFVMIACLQGNSHTSSRSVSRKTKRNAFAFLFILRETGLEPVRCEPHAPQTCASASSATLAYLFLCPCLSDVLHYTTGGFICQPLFSKKMRFF